MIIGCVLEIDAVGVDVPFELFEQDVRAEFAPARRAFELRQQRAEIEEAERLARQMCVWREVG